MTCLFELIMAGQPDDNVVIEGIASSSNGFGWVGFSPWLLAEPLQNLGYLDDETDIDDVKVLETKYSTPNYDTGECEIKTAPSIRH